MSILKSHRGYQRHLARDRWRGTSAWSAGWAMRTILGKKRLVREKCFVLDRLEQPRQDKNILYRHNEHNKPTMEGRLSSDVNSLILNLLLFQNPVRPTTFPFSVVARFSPQPGQDKVGTRRYSSNVSFSLVIFPAGPGRSLQTFLSLL